MYVTSSAPAITAFVTSQWPKVLAWLGVQARYAVAGWKRRRAQSALKVIITDLQVRLVDERSTLTEADKDEIKAEIAKARQAITDLGKQRLKDIIEGVRGP